MGRIKNYVVLSLMMVASFSCEKETIELPVEDAKASEDLTLNEFISSGINVEEYFSKVRFNESSGNLKSHSGATDEEALFDLYCGNLSVEGFEKGEMLPDNAGIFNGPLNEFTCCHKFDTGDILPGISISTTGSPVLGLYGQEVRDSYSKVIYAETADSDLLINFTTAEVNSVNLDVLSFPYPTSDASQQVTVEVFDLEEDLVHSEQITASIEGTEWAFLGDEPISKISLSSTNDDAWIGVDNIAFGECIPDADDDGCLDDEDPKDDSNMEDTIIIGSCDSGVANRMTSESECGYSLADYVDSFETGTSDYRNNGAVVKEFASLTNLWVSEGLISSDEKGLLMSCAAKTGLQ